MPYGHAPPRIQAKTFAAMGSPCEIQVYALESEVDIAHVIQEVIADIQRLESRYSRYRPDSLLSQINQIASVGGRIDVDEETASLLDYANTCFQQSNGLFDITSGLLRQAWRFEKHQLPSTHLIDDLLTRIGWEKLIWQRPSLTFTMPGMELDFGGIVKEYAADRAAGHCQHLGIQHGIINLGGDIRVIGPHPNGTPWRIGIRHPRSPGQILEIVSLYQGGLTSSGDYERCLVIDGRRYSHILNPKTGQPVQNLASVSVIADFCVLAGSASTIAMLMEQQGPDWLNQLGLPHIWMDVDGNVGGPLSEKGSQ